MNIRAELGEYILQTHNTNFFKIQRVVWTSLTPNSGYASGKNKNGKKNKKIQWREPWALGQQPTRRQPATAQSRLTRSSVPGTWSSDCRGCCWPPTGDWCVAAGTRRSALVPGPRPTSPGRRPTPTRASQAGVRPKRPTRRRAPEKRRPSTPSDWPCWWLYGLTRAPAKPTTGK